MIQYVYELGLSQEVYLLFHAIGLIGMLTFNVIYGKKYDLNIGKSLAITAFVYAVTYTWMYIQFWIESGFKNFGGHNIVRAIVYIPIIIYPILRVLKVEWKRGCDFFAPSLPFVLLISRIGCIFTGCCEGYPCSFGIPSPDGTQMLFPTQLFEAATAGIIVIIVVMFAKRRKYDTKGYAYPLMLVLFGSTRFFWEFARDNKKIFLGCSSLSFHALFMCIVGIVMILYFKHSYSKKTTNYNQNLKKARTVR